MKERILRILEGLAITAFIGVMITLFIFLYIRDKNTVRETKYESAIVVDARETTSHSRVGKISTTKHKYFVTFNIIGYGEIEVDDRELYDKYSELKGETVKLKVTYLSYKDKIYDYVIETAGDDDD